jgi:hypothetical protein
MILHRSKIFLTSGTGDFRIRLNLWNVSDFSAIRAPQLYPIRLHTCRANRVCRPLAAASRNLFQWNTLARFLPEAGDNYPPDPTEHHPEHDSLALPIPRLAD